MSRKFRNDIGFRYTRKILAALKKYLNTTISSDIIEFHSCIPKKFDQEGTYLPTKQMLQYILVRLQSLMKFMTRILVCCEDATRFYKDRIKRGQSWNVSLLTFANQCKIWSICKTLLKESSTLYSSLLPYMNKFQISGPEWLNEKYEFPTNLREWLSYDMDNEIPTCIDIPSISEVNFIDITEDDDVEYCGEYDLDCQIIDSQCKQTVCTTASKLSKKKKHSLKISKPQMEDIGETVSRTNLIQEFMKQNSQKVDNSDDVTETCKNHQISSKVKSNKRKMESINIGESVIPILKETPISNKSNKNKSVNVGGKFISDTSIVKNNLICVTQQSNTPDRTFHNINKNKNHNQGGQDFNFNNIRSARDLFVCLKQEENYRNLDLQKALSKNLGLMQWHAFKNKMLVHVKKLNAKGKCADSKNTKQLLEKIKREWRNINK